MSRAGACFLSFAALLASVVAAHGEDVKKPRTDLYGDPLPPGAVMRLGTIRLRHFATDMTFSKDGKHLISSGSYGEIRVWDVSSGALLRRKRLVSGLAQMSLAPGGAIAGAKPVILAASKVKTPYKLYDTRTGQERDRFADNAQPLAFSPDGKKLAVLSSDKKGSRSVRLWDIVEFKNHLRLESPPDTSIHGAAFAADGKHLAAVGGEKSQQLFLWDAVTGKFQKRRTFRAPMSSLAYAPDGTTLAVALNEKVEVVLVDAASLKDKRVLPAPEDLKGAGFITRLIFSPDKRLLVGTYYLKGNPGEYGALLWDLNAPKGPRRLPAFPAFAFAPDGKTLAYGNNSGGEIRLWDVASGRQVQRRPGHDTWAQTLAVSTNGQLIASAARSRNQLRLWNTATGAQLQALQGHDEMINGFLFSSDGKSVVSYGTHSSTFQLWDIASGKELQRIRIKRDRLGWTHAACLSADGKRLMAVFGNYSTGSLLAWDLATGEQRMQRVYRGRVLGGKEELHFQDHAAFSPDGERVTVWLGDRIGIEEIATGSLAATLPKGVWGAIQFAPDGRFVKAYFNGSVVTLIEVATGEEVVRLPTEEYSRTAFSPDSRAVVVADSQCLRVWDALTGEKLHEMAWPPEVAVENGKASIWSLAVLPNGRAATGMTEGDILVWDLEPEKWPRPKRGPDLSRKELDALWSDLAGNARTAYRAVHKLAMSPRQTVSFLKGRLRPPTTLDAKRFEKLLADLDSDSFAIREAASGVLTRWRYRLDPLLRRPLENKPSLEMRRRLEAILAEPKRPPTEALRMLRAIAVLERIGTREARRILEKVAGGAASPETRDAQSALQRLNRRDAGAKERSSP